MPTCYEDPDAPRVQGTAGRQPQLTTGPSMATIAQALVKRGDESALATGLVDRRRRLPARGHAGRCGQAASRTFVAVGTCSAPPARCGSHLCRVCDGSVQRVHPNCAGTVCACSLGPRPSLHQLAAAFRATPPGFLRFVRRLGEPPDEEVRASDIGFGSSLPQPPYAQHDERGRVRCDPMWP